MIRDIIAKYLSVSSQQAEAVLQILKMEQRFNETQLLENKRLSLDNMKMQADLIIFLYAIAQHQWFKGHDRSKFPANVSDKLLKKNYFKLFKQFGLIEEKIFPLPEKNNLDQQPDFLVVLGSSESQVHDRVAQMKNDLLRGVYPQQKIIYGLGCNRELGVSVNEEEQYSRDKLTKVHISPDEMGMVSLFIREVLVELKQLGQDYEYLHYEPINTSSNAKNRDAANCVKTVDTAEHLGQTIHDHPEFKTLPSPIKLLVYSKQPYIERQKRDMQASLTKWGEFDVHVVGRAFSEKEFFAIHNSIHHCLGEIARLIRGAHDLKNLKDYETPITPDELQELKSLQNNSPTTDNFFNHLTNITVSYS